MYEVLCKKSKLVADCLLCNCIIIVLGTLFKFQNKYKRHNRSLFFTRHL